MPGRSARQPRCLVLSQSSRESGSDDMSTSEPGVLANELMAAYANKEIIAIPPASRDPALDLATAYEVEATLARLRIETGRTTVGRKVGFANRAVWRALKLETLV